MKGWLGAIVEVMIDSNVGNCWYLATASFRISMSIISILFQIYLVSYIIYLIDIHMLTLIKNMYFISKIGEYSVSLSSKVKTILFFFYQNNQFKVRKEILFILF